MSPFVFLLLALVAPSLAEVTKEATTEDDVVVDYTGHKVLAVTPQTKQQLDILVALRTGNPDLDFWTEPRRVGIPVHIRLSPAMQKVFPSFFALMGYTPDAVVIDDLQTAIDEEAEDNSKSQGFSTFSNTVGGKYARLGEIHSWLDSMVAKHPKIASTFVMGKSYEGREIKGIVIGETSTKDKPVMWIHAGIHAREWIAPATCVYLIHHLLTKYDSDADVRKLVDGATWYLTPSINPDGYEYSHKYDRMWRKTRTPNKGYSCRGTDPNRNWDDHWATTGTSSYPCSDIYPGSHAFSEPNTKVVSNYILGLKDRIKVFFSLHCYSQMWLTSWGWTDQINPPDHEEIQRVAKGGTDALNARHGNTYEFGPGGSILYPAAGAEDDWAKSKAGIKYSFTIELRPGQYSRNGFILPVRQIIPTGEEVWSGVSWVAKDVFLRK